VRRGTAPPVLRARRYGRDRSKAPRAACPRAASTKHEPTRDQELPAIRFGISWPYQRTALSSYLFRLPKSAENPAVSIIPAGTVRTSGMNSSGVGSPQAAKIDSERSPALHGRAPAALPSSSSPARIRRRLANSSSRPSKPLVSYSRLTAQAYPMNFSFSRGFFEEAHAWPDFLALNRGWAIFTAPLLRQWSPSSRRAYVWTTRGAFVA